MDPDIFASLLLEWWQENKRDFPWKKTNDPYKIWISEIILQQTRVNQGTPYYLNFIDQFSDIQSLANATESEVMKAWEGLGYYSRARNLHSTAQLLVSKHNATFPDTYPEILKLKGVGPYTAAAIASFAFALPYPVVDGNVTRLISRILGITRPVNTTEVQEKITSFVKEAIQDRPPAAFNQAIMDVGATRCLPRLPLCKTVLFIPIVGPICVILPKAYL